MSKKPAYLSQYQEDPPCSQFMLASLHPRKERKVIVRFELSSVHSYMVNNLVNQYVHVD